MSANLMQPLCEAETVAHRRILAFSNCEIVGVKQRQGRLEVKAMVGVTSTC